MAKPSPKIFLFALILNALCFYACGGGAASSGSGLGGATVGSESHGQMSPNLHGPQPHIMSNPTSTCLSGTNGLETKLNLAITAVQWPHNFETDMTTVKGIPQLTPDVLLRQFANLDDVIASNISPLAIYTGDEHYVGQESPNGETQTKIQMELSSVPGVTLLDHDTIDNAGYLIAINFVFADSLAYSEGEIDSSFFLTIEGAPSNILSRFSDDYPGSHGYFDTSGFSDHIIVGQLCDFPVINEQGEIEHVNSNYIIFSVVNGQQTN